MDRVLSMVSLARKAGKAQVGEAAVSTAAGLKKARLILLASDAAENTASKTRFLAEKTGSPLFTGTATKEMLGGALGLANCAVVAITDMGLAAALAERLAEQNPDAYTQTAQAMKAKADKMDRRRRETAARKKKRG